MGPETLVLIRSNPEASHRPCEAIRISLGIAAGDIPVTIVLTEKASLILSYDSLDLVDGDDLKKHLTTLKEFVPALYVEKTASGGTEPQEGGYDVIPVSVGEIARMMAQAQNFIIF